MACGGGPEQHLCTTPICFQPPRTPGGAASWVIWISGLKGRQDLVPRLPFTLPKVWDELGRHKGPTSICNRTAESVAGRKWICSKLHQNCRKWQNCLPSPSLRARDWAGPVDTSAPALTGQYLEKVFQGLSACLRFVKELRSSYGSFFSLTLKLFFPVCYLCMNVLYVSIAYIVLLAPGKQENTKLDNNR